MITGFYLCFDPDPELVHALLPYLNRFMEYEPLLFAHPQLMPLLAPHNLKIQSTLSPMDLINPNPSEGSVPTVDHWIWITISHSNSPAKTDDTTATVRAQRNALLAYWLSLPESQPLQPLVISHPNQLNVLEPALIFDEQRWGQLCTQLAQSVTTDPLLMLRPLPLNGLSDATLFSTTPGWPEALTFHTAHCQQAPSPESFSQHWQNALSATTCWLQLAQSEALSPYQYILTQGGLPVQVLCTAQSLQDSIQKMMTTNATLLPGASLLVSQPLSAELLSVLDPLDLQQVIAPHWSQEVLAQRNWSFMPVTFDIDHLKVGTLMLHPWSPHSVSLQSMAQETRQLHWMTPHKPDQSTLQDIELGLIVSDMLYGSAALLIGQEHVVAIAHGHPTCDLAVEAALAQVAGETQDLVCVLQGPRITRSTLNALIQARVKGVLMLSPPQLPQRDLMSFVHLDFFMGTYLPQTEAVAHPV